MTGDKLPNFNIGNLEMSLIQGGMGVGVSGPNLASAVSRAGGAGIIAAVGLGRIRYPEAKDHIEADAKALGETIREARAKSNGGVLGVNIMHAVSHYELLVKTAAQNDVDMIISGAGLPTNLPSLIGNKPIKLLPIVSSLRVAKIMARGWKKYGKAPDAFIIEGPLAGGHLGYSHDDLVNGTAPKLESILEEVLGFANSTKNFKAPVPVIVAGGIYTGQDIKRYMSLGAAGVQMGTRFVPTAECDANDAFKRAYINANKENLRIIKSPVGMPGRAIANKLTEDMENDKREKFRCKFQCLKTCKPKESPYCIADKLMDSHYGKVGSSLLFAGANVYQCTKETCMDKNGKFIPVETLIERLGKEYNSK